MAASCVLFPLMGAYIVDLRSPRFFVSAAVEAVILLASLLALLALRKKMDPAGGTGEEA